MAMLILTEMEYEYGRLRDRVGSLAFHIAYKYAGGVEGRSN